MFKWFVLVSLFVSTTQARMLRQATNGIQCSSTPNCDMLVCGTTYCDPEVTVNKNTGKKTFGNGYLVLGGGYENNKTGRCYSTSDCDTNYMCSGCSEGSPLGVCVLLASETCDGISQNAPASAPMAVSNSPISCQSNTCGNFVGSCQFPQLPYYVSPNLYCDTEFGTKNSYYVLAGGSNGVNCTSTSQCDSGYVCSSCNHGSDVGVCILYGSEANGCNTLASNETTGLEIASPLDDIFADFSEGFRGWTVQGSANIATINGDNIAHIPSGCANAPNMISTYGDLSSNTTYLAVTYSFVCDDIAPFDDYIDIALYDGSYLLGVIYTDCASVSYSNSMKGWTTVEFPVHETTSFVLTVKTSSTNFGDCKVNSNLFLDSVTYSMG